MTEDEISTGGKMLFEIKSRFSGDVIFKLETKSLRLCIESAIQSRADLSGADLSGADLSRADLSRADLYDASLSRANLSGADLSRANLSRANLSRADLYDASLSRANLSGADLSRADLSGADLSGANLSHANLYDASLSRADLSGADLSRADLSRANLSRANLFGTKNMVKTMGVMGGNYYWKRFKDGLNNNNYQFKVGLNKLRKGEVFSDDERVTCAYPAFHFASKSWCAVNYPNRPLEALIQIPKKAKINEPWATDGKASADMINIIKVYDTKTGKDVTRKFKSR
jgi:hypothetical protein